VIDLSLLRDDPDRVRASQRARGESPDLVDAVLAADERRRSSVARYDSLRTEQKSIGKQVAKAEGDEKAALLDKAKSLAAEVKAAETEQTEADAEARDALAGLSNVVEDGVPAGGEDDFAVLEHVGEPPAFDFDVHDHLEIGEALGAIDVKRAATVSGSRFAYLTGDGALLELALVNFAMARATAAGFTPVIPPALVKPYAMEGTGFLGQAAENVFRVEKDDLYLVGTSEVALAAYHADEILDGRALPARYAAFSPCFRREAGSYGKDTRGIFRVHQFDKVEMFTFTTVEESYAEHRRLLDWEKQFLTALELPFRVVDVAAGDLGASAARKFDCEAWIPSQERYRELTSTSNCTEFQARRLGVRYRPATDEGPRRPRFAATLNGTLCAVGRTIVALLENHQQADGSVRVPEALRPYLGGREALEPARP
jgi:seryl-tRNA synthetase